jgi:hypothetical protein
MDLSALNRLLASKPEKSLGGLSNYSEFISSPFSSKIMFNTGIFVYYHLPELF